MIYVLLVNMFVNLITLSIVIHKEFQTKSICIKFMTFYFVPALSKTFFIVMALSERRVR
jgi:hypothetical protein